MSWNLLLALVPWALAVWAFRRVQPMRLPAVAAAVLSVVFLPNAAYVLTDVIHLPRHIRSEPSEAVVLVGVLPLFGVFMTVGFAAYLDTVRRMDRWIRSRGWTELTWLVPVAVHCLSTVGIYLGRVHRYNSWDLALRPEAILHTTLGAFTRPLPVIGMAMTFAVLLVGHVVIHHVGREIGTRAALSLRRPR